MACKGCVALLPAIFALWDARVHISPSNCGDKATNVEAVIDKFLGS